VLDLQSILIPRGQWGLRPMSRGLVVILDKLDEHQECEVLMERHPPKGSFCKQPWSQYCATPWQHKASRVWESMHELIKSL
jgi:hypothetical protein